MQIRIITDDFTSATDGLPAFSERGWSTSVCLRAQNVVQAQVASADTDSRNLPPAEAAQAVANWAKAWTSADMLIKQFDSTLRGPLVAEVHAAWQASGRKKLLVAPAFPAAGRTTVNGKVLVHGVEVHHTAFSNDPLNPVRQSSLPALFAQAGITLQIASSPAQAIDILEQHDAVVMDASNEQALTDLVAICWARREVLWAGSTGLLRAAACALPRPSTSTRMHTFTPAQRPAVVVGSHNPRSRVQLKLIRNQHELVFATPEEKGNSKALTASLVQETVAALRAGVCDGLIVTGGETAKQIAHALQARGISVLREVQAGIPLCLLHTSSGDVPLITKAGGFGNDEVFANCLRAIRGEIIKNEFT
jgi:D-threonate/D-erythronate kinase